MESTIIKDIKENEFGEWEGTFYSEMLGCELVVNYGKAVPEEYVKACIRHLETFKDNGIYEKLGGYTLEYFEVHTDIETSSRKYYSNYVLNGPTDIFNYVEFGGLRVPEYKEDGPVVILDGSGEWCEEDGITWMVAGEKILYVGTWDEFEDWDYEGFEEEYRESNYIGKKDYYYRQWERERRKKRYDWVSGNRFNGKAASLECKYMPEGEEKLEAYGAAILQADQAGDTYWRISLRHDYILEAALQGDAAWACTDCDLFFKLVKQNGDVYHVPEEHLIFISQVRAEGIMALPMVDMEKCEKALDEFRERAVKYKMGLKLWSWQACRFYTTIGDVETAELYLEQFHELRDDPFPDCKACNCERDAWFYLRCGERDKAVACLEPVLSGEYTCGNQPQESIATLMLDDLNHGRINLALPLGERLLGVISREYRYVRYWVYLLRCMAYMDHARGLELLKWCDGKIHDPEVRFYFYAGACQLLNSLHDKNAYIDVDIRPGYRTEPGRRYTCKELIRYYGKQARGLAQQFDAKFGTTFYGDILKTIGR